jgi:glycosyltransferase involved in cell wall biosynthesis
VNIRRGGAWVRYPSTPLLRRLVLELWFTVHCVLEVLHSRDADLAILVFPPNLYSLFLAFLLPAATKRIGIVHDLQAIMGLHRQWALGRAMSRAVKAVEKKAFRSCNKLIVLSDQMAQALVDSYGQDPSKVSVCYPFVTSEASNVIGRNLASILADDETHIVYSGAMGKKQNSAQLVEFFQAAAKRMPSFNFHVFSEGPAFEECRKLCASRGDSRVQFHELVDENDLAELYARSTVQVIPQVQSESNGCFPSKLPNILATGCPVLAICDPRSDLAQIVSFTGMGFIASSWDMDELLSKLKQVLDQASVQRRGVRLSAVTKMLGSRFSLETLLDTILSPASSVKQPVDSPVIV